MLIVRSIRGLGINPQGGSIQNSGAGDLHYLQISDSAVVVANALTVISLDSGAGVIPEGGVIDVSDIATIALFIAFTKGSLTSADLIPEFGSYDNAGTKRFKQLSSHAITAGVCTLSNFLYRFTANFDGVVALQNPGAPFLRFSSASVGTTTGSSFNIRATRGWSKAHPLGI